MKVFTKIIVFCLTVAAVAALSVGCGTEKENPVKAREPEYISIVSGGVTDYQIVRGDKASETEKSQAVALRDAFEKKFGQKPSLVTDWIKRGDTLEEGLHEILIGDTNRAETEIIKSSLDGEMYAVAVLNGKVVICASSDNYLDEAVAYFVEKYVTPAEDELLMETTTNEIAVRTGGEWLMARTLEIRMVGTAVSGNNSLELIAAVDYNDYTEAGINVVLSTSSGETEKSFSSFKPTAEYTVAGTTYKASDYGMESLIVAEVSEIDTSTLVKVNATPYIVEFGDTYYGISAFACSVGGSCETINTVAVDDKGVYQLSNAAEVFVFANYVNSGHRALNARLTADTDLTGATWTPIGSSDMSYKGAFEADGHTISNFYINSEGRECVGFFGCIGSDSVISNLKIDNSYVYVNKNACAGILAGESRGLISGCTVSGTISTKDKNATENTEFEKGVMQGVGGIVGKLNGKYLTSVDKSVFKGTVSVGGKFITFAGGIAGCSVAISGDVTNSENAGTVNYASDYTGAEKSAAGAGGIIGSLVNGMVSGCVNTGNVNGSGKATGIISGIVGNIIGAGQAIECTNKGTVEAAFTPANDYLFSYCSGIVGTFSGKTITEGFALRCSNSGTIKGNKGIAGGIVGQFSEARAYVKYCFNTGDISSNKYAGGICGGAMNNRTFIMNCYNTGKITSENTGGIIGYTTATFNQTYTTLYSKVDVYTNYAENYYLTSTASAAYCGSKTTSEGACATPEALKSAVFGAAAKAANYVIAHEYFVEDSGNVNGGYPVFAYTNDASKADHTVVADLYITHPNNRVNDGSRYFMVNRYTDTVEDNGVKITAAIFEERLGKTSETTHNIIDETGAVKGSCNCTCFNGKDHYLTIERWTQILDDVENNLEGVADWSNRGEVKFIGYLKADGAQESGSVALTWRLISKTEHTCLGIAFNVTYYKNERCDGATVHEMAHTQLCDTANASWIAEGDADFVKHNYYEGTDLKNYTWKEDDFQKGYSPTSACFSFLANQYGFETMRMVMSFEGPLGDNADAGWKLAFGATYQEIWDLFGVAGKYNKTAYFGD